MATSSGLPEGFMNRFWYCHSLASRFNVETEELADYFIHRRLAAILVAFMGALDMPWLFTPNRITFVSLVMGVSSAYCVLQTPKDMTYFLYAGVFEVLSITFDCCDGQLARMYGTGSLVGRVLDGICDMLVALSHGFVWVYVLCYEFQVLSLTVGTILLLVAIVTFQQQAMMYDRIKNLFVLKTAPIKEEKVVGMEESVLIRKEMEKAWTSHSYASYALLFWYEKQYLAVQNKVAAKSVDSILQEKEKEALGPEEYRAKWKSTMRVVSWCGTGTHAFLFYMLLFTAYALQDASVLAYFFLFNNFVMSLLWIICWNRVQKM